MRFYLGRRGVLELDPLEEFRCDNEGISDLTGPPGTVARLASLKGMTDANRYLNLLFLPTYWNASLTVTPRHVETKYKPLGPHQELSEILCLKHWRKEGIHNTVLLDTIRYR